MAIHPRLVPCIYVCLLKCKIESHIGVSLKYIVISCSFIHVSCSFLGRVNSVVLVHNVYCRSEWITKSWWGEGLQILDYDYNFSPFFLSSGTVTVWTAFTLGKALQFALATSPWTFLDIQKTVLPLFNVHDNIYAVVMLSFSNDIGSGFIKSRVFKSKVSLSAW